MQASITVWTADIPSEGVLSSLCARLPKHIQTHVNSIRLKNRQCECIASRYLMMSLVSHVLGLKPTHFEIVYKTGKPPILSPPMGDNIYLSLTHDNGRVAVALGKYGRVGIDLMDTRRKNNRSMLADRYFHTNETEKLNLSKNKKNALFDAYWTLKESWVKLNNIPLLRALTVDMSDFQPFGNRASDLQKISAGCHVAVYDIDRFKLGVMIRPTYDFCPPTVTVENKRI